MSGVDKRAVTRRTVVARGGTAAAGAALAGLPALGRAQAEAPPAGLPTASAEEVRRAMDAFARGAVPKTEGLLLDVPEIADNPSAVPVKLVVTRPIGEARWCDEIIVVTELNPTPLACTLRFTSATGTAEAAVRVRLAQSQTVHALARMSDGEVLHASRAVTISASGCGM